jgi:outer membrane protein
MRKIFLITCLAFFGVASAQTEKGTIIIGGKTGLDFTTTKVKFKSNGTTSEGPKTDSFNISTNLGYFVANNFALGMNIDYNSSRTKEYGEIVLFGSNSTQPGPSMGTKDSQESQTVLSFVPNATYYFSKGKIRPYLGAGLGVASIKFRGFSLTKEINGEKYTKYEETNKNTGFVWATNAGVLFLISNTVGIDLGLGYANYSFKEDGVKTSSSSFGGNVGINIFLK